MVPVRKRGRSEVWEHFKFISPSQVRCLVCKQVLAYNNNTSSMLRHYRARHDAIPSSSKPIINPISHEESVFGRASSSDEISSDCCDFKYEPIETRQELVDAALVNMIVTDSQPFSVVDDPGFRQFVGVLDPNYVIPTDKALKEIVGKQFHAEKEMAKAELEKAAYVSLTSDMWTSVNMDAYLAVTCHFVNEQDKLSTVLLGVGHFPKSHTAENIAEVMKGLMEEWGIQNKVRCLVTDGAPNMLLCAKILKLHDTKCIAHSINLIVKESIDRTPGLEEIREKARKIVDYFRSSTIAKEKLCQMQQQMGRPHLKLMQEDETRWNSTYTMLQRLFEEREPVGAALVSLKTDIVPITATEYHSVQECLGVLSPFYKATVELSEEQRVSGSKVIPLVCMLQYTLSKKQANLKDEKALQLCTDLTKMLTVSLSPLETVSEMSLATLLDPRFKAVGFWSQTNAEAAVKHLTAECANIIKAEPVPPVPSMSSESEAAAGPSTHSGDGLWDLLDSHVVERQVRNATADATAEVQRYMADPLIPRTEDPLHFWATRETVYPHLYTLALQFLCTPASCVPCERIFSKAGEIISKKRNRLSPRTVEKILFLQKNPIK